MVAIDWGVQGKFETRGKSLTAEDKVRNQKKGNGWVGVSKRSGGAMLIDQHHKTRVI